jgi:hypothetical protein
MEKRMTAPVLAPIIYRDCFKNVAGFAECMVRLEDAIRNDRKATLEAAADRWEREWWGFPNIELEELRGRASEEHLEAISRYRAAILRDEED